MVSGKRWFHLVVLLLGDFSFLWVGNNGFFSSFPLDDFCSFSIVGWGEFPLWLVLFGVGLRGFSLTFGMRVISGSNGNFLWRFLSLGTVGSSAWMFELYLGSVHNSVSSRSTTMPKQWKGCPGGLMWVGLANVCKYFYWFNWPFCFFYSTLFSKVGLRLPLIWKGVADRVECGSGTTPSQ